MKWGGITSPSLATAAKRSQKRFLYSASHDELLKGRRQLPECSGDMQPTCLPSCFRWFRSFGHFSALRALERVVRRLRTLLTYGFIPRSSLTALVMVLRLTLRFCASFDIGWFGTNFNFFSNLAIRVFVLFRSLRILCRLLWNLTFSRFRIASAHNNAWNRVPDAFYFTYGCSSR